MPMMTQGSQTIAVSSVTMNVLPTGAGSPGVPGQQ
jgi:hypothetical protein